MDYSKTLHLPKTDFPMKANLPVREPDIQKLWDEIGLYKASLEKDNPKGDWILHDGPPYSNGNVHVGNAMQNKLPKDYIGRYMSMNGYKAPFIPGWDNHGMPIENNVAAEFREKKLPLERLAIRKRCREYAAHWIDTQRSQYIRLGVRGDWQRPYLTMDPHMEASIVRVFGELADKGFIYRGLRPIYWCPTCETALADAEIEYGDHTSKSIYVFFPLKDDPNGVFAEASGQPGIVIWTTTPWTIPANLAVAVHPDFTYVLAKVENETVLLAEGLLELTTERTGKAFEVIRKLKGSDLDSLVFTHPIFDRPSPVVFADYVTLDEGTGVVHTAPGHGREDFETGKRYGLDVLNPVNEKGIFTDEAGMFAGMHIWKGNDAVIAKLSEKGRLVSQGEITHSYPHCWRCHKPVIFRATVQWFMNLDHNGHRQKVLDEISHVEWLPSDSVNRITAMVSGAPDWCVSRQRAWGVGIPVMFCKSCGKEVMDKSVIDKVADIVYQETADAWFEHPAEDFLPEGYKCEACGESEFRKETDILDVWFDSGSTCRAVLDSGHWPELSYPADVYLEGNDQHRGWFNKSLMIGVATKGKSPFRKVVTNGWMVDAEGHAMHKSKGNVINTLDVIQKYGADVARLAAASFNVMADARLGDEVLQRSSDAYRRIRNTFRFLLANLNGYDASFALPVDEMLDIDRWMLHRLQTLIQDCRNGYEAFEFHRVIHELQSFCAVDLSALYLDILKDRLYADATESVSRRSAQTALDKILSTLVRLTAPILVHTAEEVWQMAGYSSSEKSVHLAAFPEPNPAYVNQDLENRFGRLLEVRDLVYKSIEEARQSGVIGKPMEAHVSISASSEYQWLKDEVEILPQIMIVASATVSLDTQSAEPVITVSPAEGIKCERCWQIRTDVGVDEVHSTLCGRCAEVVRSLPLELIET